MSKAGCNCGVFCFVILSQKRTYHSCKRISASTFCKCRRTKTVDKKIKIFFCSKYPDSRICAFCNQNRFRKAPAKLFDKFRPPKNTFINTVILLDVESKHSLLDASPKFQEAVENIEYPHRAHSARPANLKETLHKIQ